MGSQWVRDLETIASALLTSTQADASEGATCSFCGATAPDSESEPKHQRKCPITLAQRIVDEIEFVHRTRPPM